MRICIISGSPKGEESITLQYVRFIEQAFPEHTFPIVHAGRDIKKLEGEQEAWDEALAKIQDSDGVFFATPVYFMLVPGQLKRFIELVFERNAAPAFSQKYSAALTTSIHFFDHTAHSYLHGISEDLGMHHAGLYSAHMEDLKSEDEQMRLLLFFSDYLDAISEKRAIPREYLPLPKVSPSYNPSTQSTGVDTHGKRVVILHDARNGSDQQAMVRQMAALFDGKATVADIRDSMMKGGCLGCCRCAFDNTCVYRDGFRDFWDKYVVPADILIMAGTIQDRYLSATWKQWNDRSFFNGHVPALKGKQVGYLVEGPLAHLPNLREVLEARAMIGGANLVGIVSSEAGNRAHIDAALAALAERSIRLADQGYIMTETFSAIAGRKLFRDEIWAHMRAIFQADDRYYRSHGYYDFPTKNYLQRIGTRAFSLFLCIPGVRMKVKKDMVSYMVRPLQEVVQKSRVIKEWRARKQ
ncbi:MAG TPA: NAD(P)H-dependent oxidoreductase [Methanolinea sp.]|nr:NAD(P)H-dependent oxidoreductase [Methanolinea sp.]HQK56822.1 NAD(P)H-dependent oxidoreductase [Methanolinea sp.]